ncbi:hypothetical protein C8A05DRAFT_37299 [Staphylotrichum tortipilum]|uniref:Uncharacterized protein n=1 Tax=Staphylotrichum tortipilum TaxID=2831512 RepID=A0AAN6RPY1_9PEZI|nr:hypothetical protein C8A05DRAFT_37299 [Staphylotrichum longicolle]
MTPRGTFNEADVLAITAPAGCGILSCAQVIGQAVCIANALDDDNWKNIMKCAKAKQLCNCAECFKSLGTFLKQHGVC